MVPVKLRLHGTAPAGCMAQSTSVRAPGATQIAGDVTAVRFNADGDALTSTTIWLVFNPWSTLDGSWVTIEAAVGDATGSAQVWLAAPYAGPTVTLPAAPIVLTTGAEMYLPVTLSAPPPQGMTVFFSTSDPAVLELSSEPYAGFVADQTTSDVYVRAVAPGSADLTAWYGQQFVTATVTVE
jgi:hypothetical protein